MKDYTSDPNFLRAIIMDHYQHPRNKRRMDEHDEDVHEKHMATDSCIDDIKVQAKIKDGYLVDIAFDGVACVVSTASTSIMTQLLKGKTLQQAKALIATYNQMINLEPYDQSVLEEAVAFCNVGKQANRIGCATIGWRAITEIIVESESANGR